MSGQNLGTEYITGSRDMIQCSVIAKASLFNKNHFDHDVQFNLFSIESNQILVQREGLHVL